MKDISAEAVPQLLTAVRGQVRRLPKSVAKEQASLLATQIEEQVPAKWITRQVGLMSSQSS